MFRRSLSSTNSDKVSADDGDTWLDFAEDVQKQGHHREKGNNSLLMILLMALTLVVVLIINKEMNLKSGTLIVAPEPSPLKIVTSVKNDSENTIVETEKVDIDPEEVATGIPTNYEGSSSSTSSPAEKTER